MSAVDVWGVLVTNANARQDGLAEFLHHWPQCREFRFMGSLGFGGKVYVDTCSGARVDCYPEDETPERRATIERTNAALAKLNEEKT